MQTCLVTTDFDRFFCVGADGGLSSHRHENLYFPLRVNTILNLNHQQLVTKFCFPCFSFCSSTFWLMFCQVGLIQSTVSMPPGTHHGSHTDWANKAVMYDYRLHTHTNTHWTQGQTESESCQLCTHNLMPGMMHSGADGKESDTQAGTSSVLVLNSSHYWTSKRSSKRFSTTVNYIH